MIKLKQLILRLLLVTASVIMSSSFASTIKDTEPFPLPIVAAENFYGQIAQQMGGKYVKVTSILNNPNQDPHLFSNSPSTATTVANAKLIIYNGLGYDSWMEHLTSVNKNKIIINVAELIGKKIGDNPHIWYQPNTMLVYATSLAAELTKLLPEHAGYFQQQLTDFKQRYAQFTKQIADLKKQYQGTPIIATEPVFNYLATALGFKIYGQDYQLSIMNETEPTVTQIKDFEEKLQQHQVKLLIYNNQVSNPSTQRMQKLAEHYGIPTLGVSETEPTDTSYLDWMRSELIRVQHALEENSNDPPNLSSLFQGKSGCFLLFNLTQKQWVTAYHPALCAQRISPYSTFKVPLSLMAFDQHLISQNTVFKWDGKDKGRPDWNHNQTPQSWLNYSVVWVSQLLTPQLGLDKIKHYLQVFHYGNQDFSGGLTSAWLESSLKISADEQLKFMTALVNNNLPVSQAAMANTKENLYLETSKNGWKLYGKSGSGQHLGWFVGYVQKDAQTYVFALNFSDQGQSPANTPAGFRAKDLTKSILSQFNLF